MRTWTVAGATDGRLHREGFTIDERRAMPAASGEARSGQQEHSGLAVEPGSYRDRSGAVFYRDGRILRGVSAKALRNWERLAGCGFFRDRTADGTIIPTERVSDPPPGIGAGWAAVLEHQRIPFISYPYEWTFGMLKDAALLHLELMREALAEGMILKDSSAYNVQWNGAKPAFIDVPSFEILPDGQPWIGYRQFCELFLYPLMLQAYKGVEFRSWLRGRIDGIPAEGLRPLMSVLDLVRPGVLLHVVAQNALQRRYSKGNASVGGSLAQAGFRKELILRNVEGLKKIVTRLSPAGVRTEWADYDRTHSYDDDEFAAKRAFVGAAAAHRRWRLVWDLGCNTGTFSRIAGEHADYVVSMDGDWMAIESFYRAQQSRPDRHKILPLVVDLSDPSPSQGWRGLERKSLPERGRPELTLCLALVHHIVIGANIPLADFLAWLAGLGTSLIIEFVGRDDEMVQTLLRNKDDQYDDYRPEIFEAELARRFEIRDRRPLKGGKREIFFALARR